MSTAMRWASSCSNGRPRRKARPGDVGGRWRFLIGFMGLMAEEVALLVLALWVGLEILRLVQARPMGAANRRIVLWAAAGPLLAVLLLVLGGGVITSMLTGAEGKELSLGWHADAGSRRPLGAFDAMPGGVGILGLGVIPVALSAVLLARRNRLVLALATASGGFLLTALVLQYEPAGEVTRLDGHARNFALLALLVALERQPSAPKASLALRRPGKHCGARDLADDCHSNTQHGPGAQSRGAPRQRAAERARIRRVGHGTGGH